MFITPQPRRAEKVRNGKGAFEPGGFTERLSLARNENAAAIARPVFVGCFDNETAKSRHARVAAYVVIL